MSLKRKMRFRWINVSFLCIALLCFSAAQAQQQAPYNRFQYHKYTWKVLPVEAYRLYYPRGYDSLASFASVHLPDIMAEVKKCMGVSLKSVPNLVIYPASDQLYESNIGLYENKVQSFPTISLKGSRALLAFQGSYEQLRSQLAEAWVRLCWEEQFSNDVEEQLTNKKQLMPAWFRQGSIRYFAAGWDIDAEDELHRHSNEDLIQSWEQLRDKYPVLAGQAFCYFLSRRFTDETPKQVLFQLRQRKSLNRAVRLICKRSLDTLTAQCFAFYRERNTAAEAPVDTLMAALGKKYNGIVQQLAYSPDRKQLCFVLQQYNRRTVYAAAVEALHKDKVKAFVRYLLPPWLEAFENDPYPLIDWQEDSKGFYLLFPEKGKLRLKQYDAKGNYRDSRTLYGTDGVSRFSAAAGNKFLLSAYQLGHSDIVLYDAQRLRYTALTADFADHTEADMLPGGTLVYRSGYPSDSLYHRDTLVKPYGIYYKNAAEELKSAKAKDRLLRSDSAYITWHDPALINTSEIAVTYTASGSVQRDTFLLSQPRPLQETGASSPWLQDYLHSKKTRDSIAALLLQLREKEEVSFLKKVLTPGDTRKAAQLQQDSIRRALAYTGKKVKPYLLQLHSAYFSASINNDYYINRYQPFQAYLGTFKFPGVGAMAQGGFTDLFENHHFNIGYRLPAGSDGSDFFVRYENTARKLDWHALFFRKVESLEPDPGRDWKDNRGNPYPPAAKVKTHYYELGFHYPLHYDWSLDFTTAARRDRTIFLATERYSLNYEALQSWWSISSLALRVQKLRPTLPFLCKGWEGKLLLDGMASTGRQSTLLYGTQVKLSAHQPLFRYITLVAQAQAGYSGGQSKILYNFGGLDNNIVPRVDTSVRFSQQAPYAFQSLITPLRGYQQNSLYGSTFGLLNLDLYFPLFHSLIPLRTPLSSVNQLQVGLFTDIAAAQQPGNLPAVTSPLYAYGFSARTMLAGYPLRFDMAWPGSFDKKPVWYLSLSIR
jgi:hypothetical protein